MQAQARCATEMAPSWRLVFLLLPLFPLGLHVFLRTPPSGLVIIVLWAVLIHTYLWRAEVREAFRARPPAGP